MTPAEHIARIREDLVVDRDDAVALCDAYEALAAQREAERAVIAAADAWAASDATALGASHEAEEWVREAVRRLRELTQ